MIWMKWLVIAVVLLVIEVATPGTLFFASLALGAVAAGLVSLVNGLAWLQWLVFIIVSVASIYFIRPIATKIFIPKPSKSNVDSLLGQKALVTEKINPPHMGMVKVGGTTWRAESSVIVEKDAMVEVSAVEGSHLIVKPV